MARVDLVNATIALWSDLVGTQVTIPHLMTAPRTVGTAGALVQFEGDEFPTAFRGTSRSLSVVLTARYGPDEQGDLLALLRLIDEVAPAAVDSRLLLRTHGLGPGLNLSRAVEVFEVTVTPGEIVTDVTFTATVVQATQAV